MDILNNISFDEKGLVPVIIQEVNTDRVLMMAYMNKESLSKTIETGRTWFFSRKRLKLWNKGETSGNYQEVKSIYYDCDADTLLVKVIQRGASCHTGEYSCFHNTLINNEDLQIKEISILNELYKTIKERKSNPSEESYTSYLFSKGLDKILKKVGEEASEVIIGAKNQNTSEVTYEVSDLIYHVLVLLVEMDIEIDDIKSELINRRKPMPK